MQILAQHKRILYFICDDKDMVMCKSWNLDQISL